MNRIDDLGITTKGVSFGTIKDLELKDEAAAEFPQGTIRNLQTTFTAELTMESGGRDWLEMIQRRYERDHRSAQRLTRYFGTPTTVNGVRP